MIEDKEYSLNITMEQLRKIERSCNEIETQLQKCQNIMEINKKHDIAKSSIETQTTEHNLLETKNHQDNLQLIKINKNAIIPTRATSGSVGYDLYCMENYKIQPWTRIVIPIGITIKVPNNMYMHIASRSSLAASGIDAVQSIMDSTFSNEIKVILCNNTDSPKKIEKGSRVAQLIANNSIHFDSKEIHNVDEIFSNDKIVVMFRMNKDVMLPIKNSNDEPGYTLFSTEQIIIKSWSRLVVPTGIKMKLPQGTYGHILPTFSMSTNGIDIGAGIIDSDYVGEIKVVLINATDNIKKIEKHAKIAQLIIKKIFVVSSQETESINENSTVRGTGGFGSTGK